ncbi:uncharacterized protein LOC115891795 [Sitophilus oryzae]|uniref:Uncharacterized protein LOC115891795 n=1 Tax=Sitophilus oryzae TaxID=7048 RepID=A0A6J2YYA5_SITOR|nr:uncharacterized protein LOC115891795 [Sitophilus oryzae]
MTNDNVQIEAADIITSLQKLKNRKSPGQDDIPNELLKYGGQSLIQQQKILYQHRIPDEWRTSTTILMFKRGDKKLPSNYRGINLLSTTLKLTTKVITTKINDLTCLADEQQGFRSGRSCTDAVFVIRQITEKSIEYNKPAYLADVLNLLLVPDIIKKKLNEEQFEEMHGKEDEYEEEEQEEKMQKEE